jgi:hypothetical protein
MTVGNYAEEFYGRRVVEFRSGDKLQPADGVVYRLMQEYDDKTSQRQMLEEFLKQVDRQKLEALILGPWAEASTGEPPTGYLEGLIANDLPKLRALFVGDMTFEDSEISWINQADYSDLIAEYPQLEILYVRGGTALELPATEYPALRELVIQTGGLPNSVVESIARSVMPALQNLTLWLGDSGYGFDGDLAVYQRLLEKIQPQRLSYLGLCNSEIADQLAVHVAKQEWLRTLNTLDLSMGTIGDEGARALLASPYVKGLKVLNLSHHYISPAVVKQLEALPLKVILDDPQKDPDERYVQVGE